MQMKLKMRHYKDEADYWRIREFLREVMVANGLLEKSWCVARLDYWRWHGIENCGSVESMEKVIYLWETESGQLAAVLNPEDRGDAFFQIHPAYQSADLKKEMLATAEEYLCRVDGEKRRLSAWADPEDAELLELLRSRGYTPGRWTESQWRRDLDGPIADAPVAAGYVIRSLGDESELPARSWASWRGFHPNEPDEKYEGWTWYHNIQRCPLYRRDLDIVAATPDGCIAAFATFWYDDATRTVYIEPVATAPEHQRKGLARAVITEGMRRVQRMGARRVFVGGYDSAPNALYASVTSPVCDRLEQWVKEW
jgi:GNAT superfamily N-acetyltransferase